MSEYLLLAPAGWARISSMRLTEMFPGIQEHSLEIEALLLPMFEKCESNAQNVIKRKSK